MHDVSAPKPIFVISDGTGDTAEKVVRAALHQFAGTAVHQQVFPNVTDRGELERLIRVAAREKAMVVTTLVRSDMRAATLELAREHRIRTLDVIGSLLGSLSTFLSAQPEGVPGRMHRADDDYFRRVEAVEYTVKADDGKEPRLLQQADIVLVGVSRTSKTPLSVFLAHKGFKVGNIPIVLDRPLPEQVRLLDDDRIFGLTIDPESLVDIRQQRLETMRMPNHSTYGDLDYILAELEWAEHLMREHPTWPVIDVTRKAVEETAATILKIMNERGLEKAVGEVGQL
jgi:regulator of PEP synthase PpsR (kinase-PPPase family)